MSQLLTALKRIERRAQTSQRRGPTAPHLPAVSPAGVEPVIVRRPSVELPIDGARWRDYCRARDAVLSHASAAGTLAFIWASGEPVNPQIPCTLAATFAYSGAPQTLLACSPLLPANVADLERLVQPTSTLGLDVLTAIPLAGEVPTADAGVLAELRRRYRRILIFDSAGRAAPPAIAACDAAFLLVLLGQSTRSQIDRAIRDLRRGGVKLQGTIAVSG